MRLFRFVDRTSGQTGSGWQVSYTVLSNGQPIGEVTRIKPGLWMATRKSTIAE